jgi:hypothetical protein
VTLLHLIHVLWWKRVELFWPTWCIITATVAILAACLFREAANPLIRETSRTRAPLLNWTPNITSPSTIFGLFLICYIVAILFCEDFVGYDDAQFTRYTIIGHNIPPPIWQSAGRFWPLGLQEFNLIGHFTKTVAGYHIFPIAQLVLLSCLLLILDSSLSVASRAALTAFALICPSVVTSFTALVFPERNVLFWLVSLAFFAKRFEETRSPRWAIAAIISAQVMLYYKEPAFLLLLGFAATRLALRGKIADHGGWKVNQFRDKESILDLCFFGLAVLYLVYYAVMMYPHPNMHYAVAHAHPLLYVAAFYIKVDLLAWVLVVVVIARLYRVFVRGAEPQLFWDALACGGVAYFGAYIYLRQAFFNYLAPVDLIGVLCLGHFLFSSWGRMRRGYRTASFILIGVILYQNLAVSTSITAERKYVIHEKADVARLILKLYNRDPQRILRLYFPFTSPWVLMEFAAYLSYRGVPVEGAGGETAGHKNVVIVSKRVAEDGPCVNYQAIICHADDAVDHGDLVIVLPDDKVLHGDARYYIESGEPLISRGSWPPTPKWSFLSYWIPYVPVSSSGNTSVILWN